MKSNLKIATTFFLAALLTACHDQYDICDQSTSVNCFASFYQKNGTADVAASAPALSFGLLGSSTLIYNQVGGISNFSFPLNPATDSAKYFIKISNTATSDTITVFYTSQNILLSNECGNITTHTISNAKNTLDSIKIITNTVTNLGTQNLKIWF
ncbi:MAG: hypothetical protein IPP48_08405 [Chitinophagaceae bacterium]|nr:hypothetical protein [Chitinophagaceae bacterium]